MGASREQIAAAAAEANEKYERSRLQVTEFEETSQVILDQPSRLLRQNS